MGVKSQQVFQQSAHVPQPSVSVACGPNGTVILSSSFIITNVPNGVTCQITATDSQNYLNDSFSFKNGDAPHTKTVDTGKPTISAGVVTFKTICTDDFKKTDQVGYSIPKPCTTPTPSPSNTPTVTPTRIPSSTPTSTPIPSATSTPTPSVCQPPQPVTNVNVTCAACQAN